MIEIPVTTTRLTIRYFEPNDLHGYLSFMLDEESTRFLAFDHDQRTSDGAKALFEIVRRAYGTTDEVHAYAIADKTTDEYFGSCGFSPYDEGVVECYYAVNKEHRRKGIAAEATRALVTALSANVEVRAYCHSDNVAAHAVARSCGMRHVGIALHKHSGLEGEVFIYGASA